MSRSLFVGDAVTQDEVVENKNKIAMMMFHLFHESI